MSVYFVTGATGAVGSAIVPQLLDDPDTQVRLLVRADSDATLADRLDELINFWGWRGDSEKLSRIQALRGDATQPHFGLSDTSYAGLTGDLTHILHCAGTVRMNLPLEEARHSALDSTRHTLALARTLAEAGRLAKVEFVSTLGVAGKRPGLFPEVWLDEPPAFHNTYEQAKYEAEVLVGKAIERERLPITVHRPSMVVGDNRTGRIIHFQIFYYLCEFLSGRRTLGLFPDFGGARLDVIPVNWVAEAIVASSRMTDTTGRIFHLCSGANLAPRLEAIKDWIRQAFRAHGLRMPPSTRLRRPWFAAMAGLAARLAPERRRKALSTLPIYLDYLADQQGFDNSRYLAWLAGRSLCLPDAQQYLPRVIEYYLRQRYPTQTRT